MIHVLINCFNESRNIEKCIRSVLDWTDQVHVFDGAYKQYPHEKPYSTDGTLEIVKRLASKNAKVVLHETKVAYDNQIQKRSSMFSVGGEGDYFIILDGDEYITNPEDIRLIIAREQFDVGWAWTISNLYPDPVMIARIYRYHKGMHLAGRHHWLYNGQNDLITSHQNMNPQFTHVDTDLRFFNFRDKATNSDKENKIKFLLNRNPIENKYKTELDVYKRACELVPRKNRADKFNTNQLTTVRLADSPKYTMSLMISRSWAVDPFFKNFWKLELPKSIEIVAVVDNVQEWVKNEVIKNLTKDKRFDGVKVIWINRPPLEELGQANERRKRIVSNWNSILAEARGEILLGAEDDSLPQPDAYMKLIETLKREDVDFVQGNIIGRWGARLCPAWKVITINGVPRAVYNAAEKRTGLEEIQGVGWYCFATSLDLMRKYPMYLDNETPLGGDLRQGWELTKHGYRLWHQWDIKVEHFTQTYTLIIGNETTEQRLMVKMKDVWEGT